MNPTKVLLAVWLCLAPSGCVVVYPSPNPYVPVPVAPHVHQITTKVKIIPMTGRGVPAAEVMVACEPFVIPRSRPQPLLPDLSNPRYQSYKDVEAALATYINELRSYIAEERVALERAYRSYRDVCGQ